MSNPPSLVGTCNNIAKGCCCFSCTCDEPAVLYRWIADDGDEVFEYFCEVCAPEEHPEATKVEVWKT